MTCSECGQTIEFGKRVVWHPPTERVWHVMCTPHVGDDEQGDRVYCPGGVEQVGRVVDAITTLAPADRVALAMLAL